MKEKSQSRQVFYGTREVAQILGIPEWRVKNFTEGAAYRLLPSYRIGSGKGSRRLYVWSDIFRMGIAERLVNFGFTPDSVGLAIREIPDSILSPYRDLLEAHGRQMRDQLKSTETPLLVQLGRTKLSGIWRVMTASEGHREWIRTVTNGGAAGDRQSAREQIFILNIANVCDSIFEALYRYSPTAG
jgi:hypothetical protein